MFYNDDNKMKDEEIFMAGLMSASFTEMYNIMSQILSPEKLDAMVKENEMEEARASRLEQGLSQGIEQNTITIVKNMLEKNYSYKDVSDIINKTIKEIKNYILVILLYRAYYKIII